MTIDLQSARLTLQSRLKTLEDSSEATGASRGPVALDQQSVGRLSRMDAMQGQAMAQEQERRRAHERARIELALRRVDEGTYGLCEECGEPIPERRLEIDPAATYCVPCQRLYE
ncbi:MAG: TraR/DksA family transcriptional regulator [Flavobacteriaceae bacterium]